MRQLQRIRSRSAKLAVAVSAVFVLGTASPALAEPSSHLPIQIATGGGTTGFTCSVLADSTGRCWGDGNFGSPELGQPDLQSPTDVSWFDNVSQIATGGIFGCALLQSDMLGVGTQVWCWGDNRERESSNNASVTAVPFSAPQSVGVNGLLTKPASNYLSTISAGYDSACAVTLSNSVTCWGSDNSGAARLAPSQLVLGGVKSWKATGLAMGGTSNEGHPESHGCAVVNVKKNAVVTLNGKVYCWGADDAGQLGDLAVHDNVDCADKALSSCSATGVAVKTAAGADLTGVKQIASGGKHSCAVTVAGDAYCWGSNANGQLGTSTSVSSSATAVKIRSGVTAIAAGEDHTCAIVSDSSAGSPATSVICWGDSSDGQVGAVASNPVLLSAAAPVSDPLTGRAITDVTELAAGGRQTCAIASGRSWCWGRNDNAELGDGRSGYKVVTPVDVLGFPMLSGTGPSAQTLSVSSIAGFGNGTCALMDGLQPACWGTIPSAASTLTDSESGTEASGFVPNSLGGFCANFSTPGLLRPWRCVAPDQGSSDPGAQSSRYLSELSMAAGPGVPAVTEVASSPSGDHACVVLSDGTARCVGENSHSQLGTCSTGIATRIPVVVRSCDGTGGALLGIKDIALGDRSTCVLLDGGEVLCWGDNASGQAGQESSERIVRVPGTLTFTEGAAEKLVAGSKSYCVMLASSSDRSNVACWGSNASGQVGYGTNRIASVPVVLSAAGHASDIAVSGESACSVKAGSGEIYCWGDNSTGQLGGGFSPAALPNSSTPLKVTRRSISSSTSTLVGADHVWMSYGRACASDSSLVWCWGDNSSGQLGVGLGDLVVPQAYPVLLPSGANGKSRGLPTSVMFSARLTCAGFKAGSVSCWGANDTGQAGIKPHGPFKVTELDSMDEPPVSISIGPAPGRTLADASVDNFSTSAAYQDLPIVTDGNVRLDFTASPGADPATAFYCSVDGSRWEACVSPLSRTLSTEKHSLRVRQVEPSGRSGSARIDLIVDPDPVPPPSVTTSTAGVMDKRYTGTSLFNFDLTSSLAGASYICSADGGDFGPCATPFRTTWPDGLHAFAARTVDRFGKASDPQEWTWTVDTVAPAAPSFVGGSAGAFSSTKTPSVGFSGEELATFTCSVDSGAYAPCTSPLALDFSGAADGVHTVSVKQADRAGNVSKSPATKTITVDTVKPAAPGVSAGSTWKANSVYPGTTKIGSKSATPTFDLTGEAYGSMRCRIDGQGSSAPFVPCADIAAGKSLVTYTVESPLAEGQHAIEVKQVDRAGNESATVTTYSDWFVKTPTGIPPINTVGADFNPASIAAGFTNKSTPTFELWVPSSTGLLLTGTKALVKCVIKANATAEPALTEYHDCAATDSTKDAVTYTRTTPLDDGGQSKMTFRIGAISSGTPKSMVNGTKYVMFIRQVDWLGNEKAESRTWTYDTTPPTAAPTITTVKPAPQSNDRRPKFGFAGLEAVGSVTTGTAVCSIDSGPQFVCGSGFTVTSDLADGAHSISVWQRDQAGNTSSASATYTWVVDTQAPTTAPTVTSAEIAAQVNGDPKYLGKSGAKTPTFTFLGDSAASYQCRLDSNSESAWANCGTVTTGTGTYKLPSPITADGSHSLDVRQLDAAGNAGPTATYTWAAKVTIQPISAVGDASFKPDAFFGPGAVTNNPSASIAVTGEVGTTFSCQVQRGSATTGWHLCTGSTSGDDAAFTVTKSATGNTITLRFSSSLSTSPTYRLFIRQQDDWGNVREESRTWAVDTSAPAAPVITLGPNSTTEPVSNQARPWFKFTTEPSAAIYCSLDDSEWKQCVSPYQVERDLDKAVTHRFRVRQIDVAGNVSAAADTGNWTFEPPVPGVIPKIAWTPGQISRPLGTWLKDPTPNGAKLSDWPDASCYCSNWSARQSTAAARPTVQANAINGVSALTFAGGQKMILRTMAADATPPFSLFFVAKPNTDSSGTNTGLQGLFDSTSSPTATAPNPVSGALRLGKDSFSIAGAATSGTSIPLTAGRFSLIELKVSINSDGYVVLTTRKDGLELGSVATEARSVTFGAPRIGSSTITAVDNYFNGSIAEVMMIDGVTDVDILRTESYLARRYGIALPAAHPYSTEAPMITYRDQVMDSGPAAYYPLDEPDGSVQALPDDGKSTIPMRKVAGGIVKFGDPGAGPGSSSVTFDGKSALQAKTVPLTAANKTQFSLEAWVRSGLSNQLGSSAIVRNYAYGGDIEIGSFGDLTRTRVLSGGCVRADIRDVAILESGSKAANCWSFPDSFSWHHIVLKREPNNYAFLFIDGVETGYFVKAPSSTSALDAVIGKNFVGSIDDVAFYNRALSHQEIRAHYLARVGWR